jgi:hypothetical protein
MTWGPDVEGAASQRLTRRSRLLLIAATAAAFLLSIVKYDFEAFPRHYWRGGALEESYEVCPDGMGMQIELSAELLRGEPDAGARLLRYLRATYQSSTYLISFAAAPLRLLGLPAPFAFCCVSTLGSLVLLGLFWRLLVELFPDEPDWRLLVYLVLLLHPSTLRCLIRPQSDALYALASFWAIVAGRRLAQRAAAGRPLALARVASAQLAALFVKIHAVVLPFVTPAVAFLHGLRGRRLAGAIVVTCVAPLLVWAALFQAFDLWVSIANIRAKKGDFFANWNGWRIVRIVLLTQGPLLLGALSHPPARNRFSALSLSFLLFLVGYAILLALTITPPNMRYVFPAQAPLVALAACALHGRFREGRAPGDRVATAWLAAALAWQLVLVGLYFGSLVHLRWFGPVREFPRLAAFVFDFS